MLASLSPDRLRINLREIFDTRLPCNIGAPSEESFRDVGRLLGVHVVSRESVATLGRESKDSETD